MKKYKVSLYTTGILILLSSLFIVVLFYALYITPKIEDIMIEHTLSENHDISHAAVSYIDAVIQEEITLIESIVILQDVLLGENQITDNNYYQSILNSDTHISTIEILNLDRQVIYSTLQDEHRVGIDLSLHPTVLQISNDNPIVVGNPTYSSYFNSLTLDIAYLGETCIVIGQLYIDSVVGFIDELKSSFSQHDFIIVNQYGIYIYDGVGERHLIQARFNDYDQIVEQLNENSTQSLYIEGELSIVSLEHLQLTDWIMIVYESEAVAVEAFDRISHFVQLSFIVIYVTFFIVFIVYGYAFLHEINAISLEIEAFGHHVDKAVERKSHFKEFFHLHRRFETMQKNILELNQKVTQIAFIDELTGIGTKHKAKQDFLELEKDASYAIMYIDIQRLSTINARYGYQFGDEVLKLTSEIIHRYFSHMYRVEGDEFLAFEPCSETKHLIKKIQQCMKDLQRNVVIENTLIDMSIHVGISMRPKDGEDFSELIQKSSLALKRAKANGNENYAFFESKDAQKYIRESDIELAISDAIKNEDFIAHFQPIIRIKDRSVRGFEALARWTHKDLGYIRPDEFIPVLEQTKRIHILDYKMMRDAIRFNKFMMKEMGKTYVVSVNVSVETLLRDDFTKQVDKLLDDFKYNPSLLEIEITESTIIKDFNKVREIIKYLGGKGVRFSEDDFGDAYSSLAYLSKIKIDTLKISRSFIQSIGNSIESRVLVQTIIELSKRLGFQTVVEGIEDEQTLRIFEKYDCDLAQGYYFCRPMSEEDLMIKLIQSFSETEDQS